MGFSAGGYYNNLPTRETSSSTMYKTGWNLLCYTDDGSNYNFHAYPHFTTSANSESTSDTSHTTSNSFLGKIQILLDIMLKLKKIHCISKFDNMSQFRIYLIFILISYLFCQKRILAKYLIGYFGAFQS